MDAMLSAGKSQFAMVYMDDIVILSRSVEEHLDHIRTLLKLLSRAGVSLKLESCFFIKEHIDYLGLVIQPARLGVSTKGSGSIRRLNILRT